MAIAQQVLQNIGEAKEAVATEVKGSPELVGKKETPAGKTEASITVQFRRGMAYSGLGSTSSLANSLKKTASVR